MKNIQGNLDPEIWIVFLYSITLCNLTLILAYLTYPASISNYLNLPQVSHNKTMSAAHNFMATVNYLYSIINNYVNKKTIPF